MERIAYNSSLLEVVELDLPVAAAVEVQHWMMKREEGMALSIVE